MIDVEGCRAICDAATPGPWRVTQSRPRDPIEVDSDTCLIAELMTYRTPLEARRPDAQFIAMARTALPAALAEIEQLREHTHALHIVVRNVIAIARDHARNMGLHPDHVDWKYLTECQALLEVNRGG